MSKVNSQFKITVFGSLLILLTLPIVLIGLNPPTRPNIPNSQDDQLNIEAKNLLSACRSHKNAYECYREKFKTLTLNYDANLSIKVLERIQEEDPITRNCHSIAHSIAQKSVEKNPQDWQKMILTASEKNPNFCSSGFFHGIIERHSGLDPNFSIENREIQNLCLSTNNNFREGSCLHALGHIILVEKEGEIDTSVKICGQIDSQFIDECYSGIFMENMVRRNLQEHAIAKMHAWDWDFAFELENLCLNQEGKSAKACWGEMGFLYAHLNNDNPPGTFRLCSKTQVADYRENCYKHAAFKIPLTADTQSKVNQICNVYSDEKNIEYCLTYVLSTLINNSSNFYQKAVDFCNWQIGDYQKEKCFQILESKTAKN